MGKHPTDGNINSDEECMARIGRFPKNRKLLQKVSYFWGNIIIFAAINR